MATSTCTVSSGVTSSNLAMGENELMYMYILGEGVALSCTAINGGQIHASAGGVAKETIVFNSGWLMLSGGNGLSTTLSSGGSETIANDGRETSASVLDGGVMYVNRGVCDGAKVYLGGLVQATGIVNAATVSSGGRVEIKSGGKAQECVVADGGTLLILSSGIAQSNTVRGGGLMRAMENTRLLFTTVGKTGAGTARLQISGGSSFYTSVYAGGAVSFENNEALRSTTVISGGIIQGGDLLLSSNSADEDAGRCTVRFENGGTATLSNLTIRTGGLMQVDSRTTVHFRNITLDGNQSGFKMTGMATYDPASGTCRKLLDCTAETTELWTDAQYRTLLNTTDAIYDHAFLYKDGDLYLRGIAHVSSEGTGEEAFATVQAALEMDPTGLVIEAGTYDLTDNIPVFEGVTTTINDGLFTTSVCGGSYYRAPAAPPESMEFDNIGGSGNEQNISLTINGGTFNKIVFAGDRVNRDLLTLTRTGNISTTINGGVFSHSVSGAMAVTVDALTVLNKLVGNVTLTIRGGTFNDSWDSTKEKWKNVDWIYGGSIALTKTIGGTTTIDGSVTVTLDATNNAITVANLVAGSYGYGTITGNTNLVLTGTNGITATGEIWGGCSGDVLQFTKIKKSDNTDSGNRALTTKVSGKRKLTFSGFNGTLMSGENKIRAFSDLEFKGNSDATVANSGTGSVIFSDIVNWTFEKGSKLTGNFVNDFNGDTLNLLKFDTAGTFELLTDSSLSSNDIFNAFDQLSAIKMDGNAVSATFTQNVEAQTMTWAWEAGSTPGDTPESWLGGSLEVNRTTGKMTLTTIA
ncbi:MAG: hypothetical protein J6Y92_07860 [Lentisphaeria bacterium]|nr:hypothetical protein [Lentisphaeria bacterium]